MSKVLLLCPMKDGQTGVYLHDSIVRAGHDVAYFDFRAVNEEFGTKNMNDKLVSAVDQLRPDVTLIIKGLGIFPETIRKMREVHPHKILGWIFDVTLGGTMVKDVPDYIRLLKELDTFYTIDADAVPELKALGVKAAWLPEGCHSPDHDPVPFNYIQKKKYGADVVFLGSVGGIHKNRDRILKRIHDEGFDLKLYGEVFYPEGNEPEWVKECHTGYMVTNDYHSIVCNSSKIVIGIDGWPSRSLSYSARLYRTLCAGSFYLTTKTKDMEQFFVPGKHLDVYNNDEELIEKIIYYLTNEEEREAIAKAGREEVVDKHSFTTLMKEILD